MTKADALSYWINSAEESKQVAAHNAKNHQDWAFFFWHLAIEKLLKALITKRGEIAPPTHDLIKLAKLAGIELDKEETAALKEITTYNIEARYDDYKRSFYRKVTGQSYANEWFATCGRIYLWLKKQI